MYPSCGSALYSLFHHYCICYSEKDIWKTDSEMIREEKRKLEDQAEQDAVKVKEYNVSAAPSTVLAAGTHEDSSVHSVMSLWFSPEFAQCSSDGFERNEENALRKQ